MTDDNLLHLDSLKGLAERAAAAHAAAEELDLDYERFGICTPDLLLIAKVYSVQSMREALGAGMGLGEAGQLAFIAGFDIGYQARLELESRTLAKAEDRQPNPLTDDGSL